MRLLWSVVKVVLVLALVIPVGIIVLATALGLFGALLGLAFMALRLALIGLIGYGVFRLAVALFRSPAQRAEYNEVKALPPVDPYYEAAKRELDRDLGPASR